MASARAPYKWMHQYPDKSDEELIALYKSTYDVSIVGCLFYRYYELLYGLGLKYFQNGQDAEDACYEIFEILISKLKKHDVQYFKSWLYRLSSNFCIDKIRKLKVRDLSNYKSHLATIDTYSQDIFSNEDHKEQLLSRVEQCMNKLSLEQKECIQLFYFQEQSYQQIADLLQLSWAQTRSCIQNGKRNLKICMEQI